MSGLPTFAEPIYIYPVSEVVGTYLHMDVALKKRIADRARVSGMTQRSIIHEALTAYLDGTDAATDAVPRQEQLDLNPEGVALRRAS